MNLFIILAAALLAAVYSWTFYNLPVLLVGIRSHLRAKKGGVQSSDEIAVSERCLPTFSVLIPAKNEELLLPRLLEQLLHQNYPEERVEIIVIGDGSTDKTADVCREYARKTGGRIRFLLGESSKGKPSALNRALNILKGDIVAVFDADNVPEPDTLLNAAKCFVDELVTAVQGRTLAINSEINMLTKFVSLEESAWFEAYIRGKDALELFVHLKGTCQFIRKEALLSLGGWSEGHLAEDMEISARLTEKGHKIRYSSDVRAWQETPESLTQMFRQRVRWYRGSMEVALRYGRLISKPSVKRLDAEITLLGPFVLIVSLLGYLAGPLLFPSISESAIFVITVAGWTAMTATLIVGALALLYVARPKRKRDFLWLPFIYAYWTFQVLLASWALIEIVLRAPRKWRMTGRTGAVNTGRQTSPGNVAHVKASKSADDAELIV